MVPVEAVATLLVSEAHSPMRSRGMNSTAIKNDAPSSNATGMNMNDFSPPVAESSPMAGFTNKNPDETPSAEGQHEIEGLAKSFIPSENEEVEPQAAGDLVDNSHSEKSSRAGTFVTPKRIKINHEALSSRNSDDKEDSFSAVSASLGNAVTPASIRGANTPGIETCSPDSLADSKLEDKSNAANGNAHVPHERSEPFGDVKSSEVGEEITTKYAVQGENKLTERSNSGGVKSVNSEEKTDSSFLDMNATSSKSKSVNLGPRMCVRKSSPPKAIALMPRKQSPPLAPSSTSPVVPRRLDSTMANNDREQAGSTDAPSAVAAAAAAAAASGLGAEVRDSIPSAVDDIPPPSHFLAAKISPLRSSSRLKKSESKIRGRDSTPPPPSSAARHETTRSPKQELPDISDAKILSPCGFFLSPRTPKLNNNGQGDCLKSSASACLTPSNFASDFGKGHKTESSFDASDVFSWLKSPTGQGLFSPGLTALSVTNTPRGMYGFFGASGNTSAAPSTSGKTPFTPSTNLAPSVKSSSLFFSDVEDLPTGGEDIPSPKASDNQRSMICISPLASQKASESKKTSVATESPINFNDVFASPRYQTPRLSSRSAKKDVNPSPVASALHTAERDILEDADLNDLLNLAGATTPGGKPLGLLSPILTNSFRKILPKCQRGDEDSPPESLQLPMISGSNNYEPATMLARKGSLTMDYSHPPKLSIRSSSSGVKCERSNAPPKNNKSKKRKPSKENESSHAEGVQVSSGGQHHPHHHGMTYPHPNMLHYRPHPGQLQPHSRHGTSAYYHQAPHHPHSHHMPSHHSHNRMTYPPPHSAPHRHYAYSEQQGHLTVGATDDHPMIKSKKLTKRQAAKTSKWKGSTNHSVETSAPPKKKVKKCPPKKPKNNTSAALSDPEEKERVAAAIRAVNQSSGGGNEKAAALAAAILRGVTMRPSGKWQAQLYYAGKSRYIGVFDSREKAALAYEIAREVLKTDKGSEPTSATEMEKNVSLARKAAFAGVNEGGVASK